MMMIMMITIVAMMVVELVPQKSPKADVEINRGYYTECCSISRSCQECQHCNSTLCKTCNYEKLATLRKKGETLQQLQEAAEQEGTATWIELRKV